MKSLGIAVAVALCAAFTVGPGLAQEQGPKAGSGRDAPPADGVDIGAMNGGTVAKSSDRGAGQSGAREGDTVHTGSAVNAGADRVANRKGTIVAPGVLGTPPSSQGVTLDHGMSSIRPSEGLAALLRRANRKMLIAITPSAAPSTNIGAHTLMRPGADGGAMRNAIGVVVADGGQGSVGTSPGAIGVGKAAGNVGGVDVYHPAIPLNAISGPAAHTTGINGTTMSHIASGPSYIGGPARGRSGINGTTVRPRH